MLTWCWPFFSELAPPITSITSIGQGSASASFASSFASAMLRSIQRLSASLTISAASGELSVITSIAGSASRQNAAPAVACGRVDAADQDRDRGEVPDRLALGQPLGAEGHVHVRLGGEDRVVHQPAWCPAAPCS